MKKIKRWISMLLAILLISGSYTPGGYLEAKAEEKEQEVSLNNPVVGDRPTWDCVWFGSYPQSEITDKDAVYTDLENSTSGWNSKNDIVIGNAKYRRVKKSDAVCAGGATYPFANGDYDWPEDDSWHYFKYEPIKWRVLKVDDEQIFLYAAVILDCQRYNDADGVVTWEESTLRSWLNGYGAASNKANKDYSAKVAKSFIDSAFSRSERASILDTAVMNEVSSSSKPGGNNTTDKVFLLSEYEVSGTDAAASYGFDRVAYEEKGVFSRENGATIYAKAMGTAECSGGSSAATVYYEGNAYWWLRSLCLEYDSETFGPAVVDIGGSIYMDDTADYGFVPGVCPALRLKRSSQDYFYAGTVGESYVEVPCPKRPIESEKCTVTFQSGGGSEVEPQAVEENSTIQKPEDPTREGYTFLGWFNGTEEWNFETGKVTDNLILTAKWEKIPEHQHSWDEGEVTTEPTCVGEGEKTFHCQTCEATRTEKIPATGEHKWDGGEITIEPTCGKEGERTIKCQTCEATKTEKIPATDEHKWDGGEATTEPTCVGEGEKTFHCQTCEATKTEKIPATGEHKWDGGEATTEPTCVKEGERTFHCQTCGATRTEKIPATGEHKWDGGEVTTEPTCVGEGEKTFHCQSCEATKTEKIPATGEHKWGGGEVTTEPTCVGEGEKTFHCQTCEATKTEKIPATGAHEYEYTVLKRATVLEEGIQSQKCRMCGTEKQQPIPKLTPTIKLNVRNIPLQVKQSTKKVKVNGLAFGDRVKSWRSSNSKIVKVTNAGKITAGKKAGKATLTVTLLSGKKSTVKVKVQKGEVKTAKISGLPKKAVMKIRKRMALKPLIAPITSVQKLTYMTSNKKVATVDKKGIITAKKAGKALITVKSGEKKFTVSLTVKK